jgi:hypothetical protein
VRPVIERIGGVLAPLGIVVEVVSAVPACVGPASKAQLAQDGSDYLTGTTPPSTLDKVDATRQNTAAYAVLAFLAAERTSTAPAPNPADPRWGTENICV